MGSAEECEVFYDSLEEEVGQFRCSSPNRASFDDDDGGGGGFEDARCLLPTAFQTPPNTSRFLNCFDNLDVETSTTIRCRRILAVSPATDVEDMEHLATAFQNLRLEDDDAPSEARSDLHRASRSRRNVRRSKSCTSLGGGKNANATRSKKNNASTSSKLRLDSLTSFKSKCNSYLEMYHRRKNAVKGLKQTRASPPPAEDATRRNQQSGEPDLAPPPTTRTSYDGLSFVASVRGGHSDEATYKNVGDFRVFPADVDNYLSVNLNPDGVEWKPRNVAHRRSASGGRVKHHSYVPYSIKDYRTLQVPKLGSLGYDREAVRDKYERMKRQRAYGMQASVRNRSKMAAAPPRLKDQKGAAAKPATVDMKQQQKSERHKATRKHIARSKTVAKKPQGDKAAFDLKPLVERHLKEMQASAIIRQNFNFSQRSTRL